MINNGLDGVIAAETALSMVDGERGELVIAGFPVAELALNATFEETVEILLECGGAATAFKPLKAAALPPHSKLLRDYENPMDALRIGVSLVQDERDLLGSMATIVAAHHRLRRGADPIHPRSDIGYAANYLYMLDGEIPSVERVRALETYLNTVVDHGLNASTFTARVIISTGSDLISAVAGALGALKGPLHGGAPGPALDMVFEIGDASRAEEVLRKKIEAGEKLMGFGHRVYKVRDPRADVLAAAAERLYRRDGDMRLYELAKSVEATAIRLLEEYKPGRRLQTNVEFYTALLLHGLGLDVSLFTPTFAISRTAGWIAHCFEQRRANRIIRPQSVYIGPRDRTWDRLRSGTAAE